jgi:Flp pilus assembly secretin CpaC
MNRFKIIFIFLWLILCLSRPALAQEHRFLLEANQEVLNFEKDIKRVAISDENILNFTLITNSQLLIQAKKLGKTNVLIWFADGEIKDISYSIGNTPHMTEKVIEEAVRKLDKGAGDKVTVRRIVRGAVANDKEDLFILEGRVPNQVALTRVLAVAGHILGISSDKLESEVRVLADEAGALVTRNDIDAGSSSGTSSMIFQTGTNSRSFSERSLNNRIGRNIARAKALELANGRLLSFIEVEDIPRVRIAIKFIEVDRDRLKTHASSLTALGSDFTQSRLSPKKLPTTLGGAPVTGTALTTGSLPDVQNALSVLSGSFTNQTQVALDRFAIEAVLSYLEFEQMAKTLSQPTLNVLSGETALFSVGGEIPIAAASATTTVVFNVVEFAEFGIQLAVRPLVQEDESIVIDLVPRVSDPVPNSVSSINSAPAFESKSLKTTAKILDGQTLLIGGLIQHKTAEAKSETPGVAKIPLLGALFKGYDKESTDTELMIVVIPTIERDPVPGFDLWQFPEITTKDIL